MSRHPLLLFLNECQRFAPGTERGQRHVHGAVFSHAENVAPRSAVAAKLYRDSLPVEFELWSGFGCAGHSKTRMFPYPAAHDKAGSTAGFNRSMSEKCPSSARAMFRRARSDIRAPAWAVVLPTCGVITTFGSARKSSPGEGGA